MQQIPQAAAEFYRQQQRISDVTARAVSNQWAKVGDDFTPGWDSVRGGVADVVQAGLRATTRSAAEYTPKLISETGLDAAPVGGLQLGAFSEAMPDGSEIASAFDAAPIRAKQAVAGGATSVLAREMAGAWLSSKVLTALADTRRNVVSVDLAQRPTITGYVRMLNGASCPRCTILAGKWFRWNEGFQRHPNCDCVHIPAKDQQWAEAEGFVSDPYEEFFSLTEEEQDRLYTKAGAQAIRDGGDIYRVVNINQRGLGVSRQAVRYGTPMRMTPNDIYELKLSRSETINLLEREGYITGPQTGGGNIVGRYREAYQQPISRAIVPGSKRERVLRARETGVRDPLDRATMTAQERRLFDAVYRREYARKYGYLPRSVGQNSADLHSGLVGLEATPQRLAMLDAEISRYLSRIGPRQHSMIRLADELGLRGDEFKTGEVFRKIENRVGTAALQTGGANGGGRKPPTSGTPSDDFGPEPPEGTPKWKRYWRERQERLDTNKLAEALEPHEVRFYERFISAGNRVELIPRSKELVSTSDFRWLSRSGVEVEVKRPDRVAYDSAKRLLRDAVNAARRNHSVVKAHFILDLGERPLPEKVQRQLGLYNIRNPENRIERLWVWSQGELIEIPLKRT